MEGRGKGGKGLGLGEVRHRAVKRLYEPENPKEIYRTLEDGYYLNVAKKKKLNDQDNRKRNDHVWLNTIVLRNVYEYLEFQDQLRFRLVNCGMNEELSLKNDEELGEGNCPWYSFQMMLNFERFCREMKQEELSVMRSRKILYNFSGCLNRIQGEIRNAQVCCKSLVERENPFKNYFVKGEDLNFKKLVENEQYVNLFKSGVVKYTDWAACTLDYSEGSSCEIKIKKKSKHATKPSFVYLKQCHFVGMNGREGTQDESYYLLMREEGSTKTTTLMEYLFYRDPQGEGYTKKSKIAKLLKTCELPNDWDYEKFISFLMTCSNSLEIRMDYDFTNLWERIKTSAVNFQNALQDDEIEEDEEDEEEKDEEDDEEDEEDEEEAASTMGIFSYEGDEMLIAFERSGQTFMDKLISKSCHHNKTASQTYSDLVSLYRLVLDISARSNFAQDLEEEFLGVAEIIKSRIVKTELSTGFLVSIGEYVTQSKCFAEVTLHDGKSRFKVEVSLSDVQGYNDRLTKLQVFDPKENVKLIDLVLSDYEKQTTVDPDFKELLLGKDAASTMDDTTFVALFGLLSLRVHNFLFADARLVRCIDNEVCFNPLMELLFEN